MNFAKCDRLTSRPIGTPPPTHRGAIYFVCDIHKPEWARCSGCRRCYSRFFGRHFVPITSLKEGDIVYLRSKQFFVLKLEGDKFQVYDTQCITEGSSRGLLVRGEIKKE